MILKYFLPELDFSWEELDKITNKQPDLWTWQMAGLCWFVDNNFDVTYIEEFDYEAFAQRPYEYLQEKYGPEMAAEQQKHSNLEGEMEWTQKFLQKVKIGNYVPDLAELTSFLDQGFLVVASVNYRSLYNREGFVGHSVVVVGYDDEHIIINDPGLPGRKNHKVTKEQFLKGWSYPDDSANNISAIKLS